MSELAFMRCCNREMKRFCKQFVKLDKPNKIPTKLRIHLLKQMRYEARHAYLHTNQHYLETNKYHQLYTAADNLIFRLENPRLFEEEDVVEVVPPPPVRSPVKNRFKGMNSLKVAPPPPQEDLLDYEETEEEVEEEVADDVPSYYEGDHSMKDFMDDEMNEGTMMVDDSKTNDDFEFERTEKKSTPELTPSNISTRRTGKKRGRDPLEEIDFEPMPFKKMKLV